MTSYYLLRKNQESGPFTLREMKTMTLFSNDLIWINGESTFWKHPDEIDGFQGLAKEPEKERAEKPVIHHSHDNNSLRSYTNKPLTISADSVANATFSNPTFVDEEEETKPSFEELQKKYAGKPARKRAWKQQINIGNSLIGLTTLLIGVMAAAFMIKKAVDNIDYEPMVATAETQEIQSEQLPASTTDHAALAPSVPEPSPAPSLENVPTTETLPQKVSQVSFSTKSNTAVRDEQGLSTEMKNGSGATKEAATVLKNDIETTPTNLNENEQVKAEAEEKGQSKSNLQLNASNFKVGLLGGVSNLELSLSNESSQAINKAIIEVSYLKPNGKVVSSQTVEVTSIAPGATKKIAVPDHNRGVDVRYRIVSVEG